MEPLGQHGRVSGLLVLLGLLALRCAHSPVVPPPLAPEVRERLGRIGVAYQGPALLWVEAKPLRGAGRGAEAGGQMVLDGISGVASRADPLTIAGLILLSPGIVAGGALVGAALTPSATAVAEAETVLNEVAADPGLATAVRERFLQAVRRRRPQAVLTLPAPEQWAEEESSARVAWAWEGIETVLQVQGPGILLVKGRLAGSINPALRLSVSLGTRVIRTADGEVLYWSTLVYDGEARTYTGWAADNAQPLREAVARAMETLVHQSVALMFGPETAGGEATEPTP